MTHQSTYLVKIPFLSFPEKRSNFINVYIIPIMDVLQKQGTNHSEAKSRNLYDVRVDS